MRRKKQEAAKARFQEATAYGELIPFDRTAFETGRAKFNNPDFVPLGLAPVAFTTKNGIRWVVADMDRDCDVMGDAEEDQVRWAPSANGKPVRLLGRGEAAEYTGVEAPWVGLPSYIPFPCPDGYLGQIDDFFGCVDGEEGWLQSTLDKWNERPGPGQRWTNREFLDREGVIRYLRLPGRSPFAGVALPAPDVCMRRKKGWLTSTIDSWACQLPDGVLSPRPEPRPVDDDGDYR